MRRKTGQILANYKKKNLLPSLFLLATSKEGNSRTNICKEGNRDVTFATVIGLDSN